MDFFISSITFPFFFFFFWKGQIEWTFFSLYKENDQFEKDAILRRVRFYLERKVFYFAFCLLNFFYIFEFEGITSSMQKIGSSFKNSTKFRENKQLEWFILQKDLKISSSFQEGSWLKG